MPPSRLATSKPPTFVEGAAAIRGTFLARFEHEGDFVLEAGHDRRHRLADAQHAFMRTSAMRWSRKLLRVPFLGGPGFGQQLEPPRPERIKRLRQALRHAVERALDIDDDGDDRAVLSADYALGRSDYIGYRGPRLLALALAGLALLSTATHGNAMTFEVWNVGGEPAIIGRGEVREGDAARLENVLTKEARHSAGYFALTLNSPGGSVEAAFDIARVIDAHNVNVYVPSHFVCVSACAAIVFIAGHEHVVLPGGLLGFHGCYNSRTNEIVYLCNHAIAQHALEHRTAYGSVMAFIDRVPYDEIVWLNSEEVDCYAISRYEITPPPPNFEQCVFEAIRRAAK